MSILDVIRTMPDKDLERSKLELSNSYRQIMGTMAFKNLTDEMDKLYSDAYKSSEQCDIKEFSLPMAAEARGVRKAIDALRRRIDAATKERR